MADLVIETLDGKRESRAGEDGGSRAVGLLHQIITQHHGVRHHVVVEIHLPGNLRSNAKRTGRRE